MLFETAYTCEKAKGSHTMRSYARLGHKLAIPGEDGDDATPYQERIASIEGFSVQR
jgi:hypothetical protein